MQLDHNDHGKLFDVQINPSSDMEMFNMGKNIFFFYGGEFSLVRKGDLL